MTQRTRIPGDEATVSIAVAVEPSLAFEIFTEEIDQWWRHGRRYRIGKPDGVMHLEPRAGGRLFESFAIDGVTKAVETGRVLAWEPPARLLLEWRAVNFAPEERTEVEVLFEPSASGTLVTVRHRGWSHIRADHPARHGQPVPVFIRTIGMWWADLMSSLREHAARRAAD